MITEAARQRATEYLTGVPALTLQQPWPVAIEWPERSVAKVHENRSWLPPTSVKRMFIHTGKGWDPGGWGWLFAKRDINWSLGTASAITSVVDIAGVCSASRWSDSLPCDCGPWTFPGQYHWQLANVVVLPEPVPCRGAQKLWRPVPDVVAAVTDQLAEIFAEKEPDHA